MYVHAICRYVFERKTKLLTVLKGALQGFSNKNNNLGKYRGIKFDPLTPSLYIIWSIQNLPGQNMSRLQINVKIDRKPAIQYTRNYLEEEERRELIATIGDAALLLLEYYIRLAAVGDREISDEAAAQYFGWSIQKAKRNRLALQKAGWFKKDHYSIRPGLKGVTYYIGKESVVDATF